MNILQVSTSDSNGGAQGIALQLHRAYRARGHHAWLAVGRQTRNEAGVISTPRAPRDGWTRTCESLAATLKPHAGKIRGARRVSEWLSSVAYPKAHADQSQGLQEFRYAGRTELVDCVSDPLDLIHCHNLHGAELPAGGYFDLNRLSSLSDRYPVMLTLHDAWLLSGHCAHSLNCEKWKSGCGHCPDLGLYPAVRKDATAINWKRKQDIFNRSRLYVATPSRWLMNKVEQSILASGMVEGRVIPNGVDLDLFKPGHQQDARARLGLPTTGHIVLFAANAIRHNSYKDFRTMRDAVAKLGASADLGPVHFVALGESGPAEQIGQATIHFVPYQSDPSIVADYYRAADVYIHAATADTFPSTVLESLACGVPVVATAVGGIPEQIRDWQSDAQNATGALTPAANAVAMAEAIQKLLSDSSLRQHLSRNASADAQARFNFESTVSAYLNWYGEILSRKSEPTTIQKARHEYVALQR